MADYICFMAEPGAVVRCACGLRAECRVPVIYLHIQYTSLHWEKKTAKSINFHVNIQLLRRGTVPHGWCCSPRRRLMLHAGRTARASSTRARAARKPTRSAAEQHNGDIHANGTFCGSGHYQPGFRFAWDLGRSNGLQSSSLIQPAPLYVF